MTKSRNWFEHLKEIDGPRIHLIRDDLDTMEHVLDGAAEADYRVFRLNLAGAGSKSELFTKIAEEMNFPAYFGRNWDALLDMLSDLSWWEDQQGFLLLIDGSDELLSKFPKDFSVFFEVVLDAIERMRSWGKSMHAVVAGDDVPRFELETAVGVMSLCDHSPS